jgi:hypothetical protein
MMEEEIKAKFIYKPPESSEKPLESLPIRFLQNSTAIGKRMHDDWVVNLKRSSDHCLDCERQEHLWKLNEIGAHFGPSDIAKLRDALIFLLENTNYPVHE